MNKAMFRKVEIVVLDINNQKNNTYDKETIFCPAKYKIHILIMFSVVH